MTTLMRFHGLGLALLIVAGWWGSAAGASLWSSSATPATLTDPDTQGVTLGVKFRSDVAGTVTGIRFYKGPQNTGVHTGQLWSSSGTLLSTVTFTGETASGWQQAMLATPRPIAANTVYIVSYFAPRGRYSVTERGFSTQGVDAPPLHAPATTVSANGVYRYGSSVRYPNKTYRGSNYWVDVVFESGASPPPPPVTRTLTISVVGQGTTSPVAGASVRADGVVVPLASTPASGWTGAVWTGPGCGPSSVTMTQDRACTATFAAIPPPVTRTLTIVVVGQGTTSPLAGASAQADGAVVPLSGTPVSGWTGPVWTGTGCGPSTVTMAADRMCTATFAQVVRQLSIAVVGQGTTLPPAGVSTHLDGTIVLLSGTPASSWTGPVWSGLGCDQVSVAMTENRACSALFTVVPTGHLTLLWTEGVGGEPETGFHVERSAVVTPRQWSQVGQTLADVVTYVDAVPVGTAICYRVRAFNLAGASDYTDEACGTP